MKLPGHPLYTTERDQKLVQGARLRKYGAFHNLTRAQDKYTELLSAVLMCRDTHDLRALKSRLEAEAEYALVFLNHGGHEATVPQVAELAERYVTGIRALATQAGITLYEGEK